MASAEELSDFNHAVSDWSNQFAPELRKVAYVIGSRMGWNHNEFQIAWSSLQRHYQKAHGETVSEGTLKKYARLWADHGGLKIVANYRETNGPQLKKDKPNKRGKDGKHVGTRGGSRMNTDASNTFAVDFNTVVKARRVPTGHRGRPVTEYYTKPWEFGSVPAGQNCLTPQLPLNSPSVTPYSSLDSSENYSSYSPPGGARELLSSPIQSQTPSVAGAPSGEVSLGVIREEAARILSVKPGRLGHWPWPEIEDAVTKYGADTVLAEVTRIAGESKRFGDDPVAHFRASVRNVGFYRLERVPPAAQPAPALEPEPEPEPGPSLPGSEHPDDTHVYPVIVTKDGIGRRASGQMPRHQFGHVARYLTQEQADNRFGSSWAPWRRTEPRTYAELWGNGQPTGRVLTWWSSRSEEPYAEKGRYWVETRS
jgi:hypothetical protein